MVMMQGRLPIPDILFDTLKAYKDRLGELGIACFGDDTGDVFTVN
ncbi:MAG: hypothetical protein ACI8SR_002377 [Oceanicoccus sp.]|jgi:hypothetical protein